jgi:hypothetical protein
MFIEHVSYGANGSVLPEGAKASNLTQNKRTTANLTNTSRHVTEFEKRKY